MILARLSEQSERLEKQQQELKASEFGISPLSFSYSTASPNGSVEATPDTETFITSPKSEDGTNGSAKGSEEEEINRLKEELNAANSKLAKMDKELAQTRIAKHTFEQAVSASPEFAPPVDNHVHQSFESGLQGQLPASTSSNIARTESWMAQQEDAQSDMTDPLGAAGVPLSNQLWGKPGFTMNLPKPIDQQFPLFYDQQQATPTPARAWIDRNIGVGGSQPPFIPNLHAQRSANFRPEKFGDNNFVVDEPPAFGGNQSLRRHNIDSNRALTAFGPPLNNAWGPGPNQFNWNGKVDSGPAGTSFPAEPLQPAYPAAPTYMPRPIGTRLSPTASEFNVTGLAQTPWNAGVSACNPHFLYPLIYVQPPSEPATTYTQPTEPLNYRRLLDRNMSCNWKYIVDKIVCNNDQQASIFLQQKLKVGTPEQKYEIVQAIIGQAYSLMVNRFGNFLVQRCFEHGTSEQIIDIAKAIRSNTLNLSMDAFGCHVIQKAFDAVPEEYKAMMVHELLRRIPETVIHRYACHVWQKLFELRWSDSPPQIMKYVNEALRGMWHEVALGETGSLVVQNIFENCLEEDKVSSISD